MSFVSRWVIRQEHRVESLDRDAEGFVRDETVDDWIAQARDAYLDHCPVLQAMREQSGFVIRSRPRADADSTRLGQPAAVVVTAGTTEVRPTSFTMAFRLRPMSGSGDVVNSLLVLGLEDPATGDLCELGDKVRDELIALEHDARYTN